MVVHLLVEGTMSANGRRVQFFQVVWVMASSQDEAERQAKELLRARGETFVAFDPEETKEVLPDYISSERLMLLERDGVLPLGGRIIADRSV